MNQNKRIAILCWSSLLVALLPTGAPAQGRKAADRADTEFYVSEFSGSSERAPVLTKRNGLVLE